MFMFNKSSSSTVASDVSRHGRRACQVKNKQINFLIRVQSDTLRQAVERKNASCVNHASQHLRWEIPCGEQQLTLRLNIDPSRGNPDTAPPHAQLVYLHVVISWKV